MPACVLPIDLPADAIDVARRLSTREGVVLARRAHGSEAFVACDPVEHSEALDPEPSQLRAPRAGGDVPRWFGLIPYEALREDEQLGDERPAALLSKPAWFRYRAVVRVGERVEIVAEDAARAHELAAKLRQPPAPSDVRLALSEPIEAEALHLARIERALVQIAEGNTYEVNLARRLSLSVTGAAWDVLAALEQGMPEPQAFALNFQDLGVAAATPELCVSLDGHGRLLTSPIKGTRPRDADPRRDSALSAELDADPKERAELTMILDVERNDFGKVAEVGSVRVVEPPHVLTLPSVHHRLATIAAQLRPAVSRAELLRAVLPSGSVTGAPKRRAMQLIAALEPHRRGLYTGVGGYLRQAGGLELAMAIRTLVERGGSGHYFVGGGIVADSRPTQEVAETLWKAARLLALLPTPRQP